MLPLSGTRVLDAGGAITAYCSKLLDDLGADVTVVEPPEGHELRRRPPFGPGGESLVFAWYHGGAHSVTADPAPDELAELGRGADVILVSPSPATAWPGFEAGSPRPTWAPAEATVCALTPFGVGGPYARLRVTHLGSCAASGAMHRYGPTEGPPLVLPGQLHWDLAATHAAVAVLAAGGMPGQTIDVSAQEVETLFDFYFDRYAVAGAMPAARVVAVGIPPTGMWECVDGVVEISAHQDHHWTAFLRLLGDPAELSEPALAEMATRRELAAGLAPVIAELIRPHQRHELLHRGQALGLPMSLLQTPGEFVGDEQLAARGAIVERRGLRLPASPLRGLSRDHPPERTTDPPAKAAPPPSRGRPPLEGVRVLSFGAFVAGNTTALTLSGLGAEVVKIEARARPEVLRRPAYGFEPRLTVEPSGVPVTPMYAHLARDARSLALDVATPRGRELFGRLVATADVVLENFGAGTMDRWGIGFEHLLGWNERIVLLSLSGYGRTGPRAGYLAYAGNISNFCGLTSLYVNHGLLSDHGTAAHGALAVLAALGSGGGVHLDLCQTEVMAALLAPVLMDPLVNDIDAGPTGNAVPGALASGVHRCAGLDNWVAVEITTPEEAEALARLLGDEDLDAWCANRSHHSAAHLLQRAGVQAAAVQTHEDVVRDPQLRVRGCPVAVEHPDLGPTEHPFPPHRMDLTPPRPPRPAARLGADTDAVLRSWLGLDDAELDWLEADAAIFRAGQPAPSGGAAV